MKLKLINAANPSIREEISSQMRSCIMRQVGLLYCVLGDESNKETPNRAWLQNESVR